MWKCALALPTTSHNPIPISAPSERRGSFFGAYQSSTIVACLQPLLPLPFPENTCKNGHSGRISNACSKEKFCSQLYHYCCSLNSGRCAGNLGISASALVLAQLRSRVLRIFKCTVSAKTAARLSSGAVFGNTPATPTIWARSSCGGVLPCLFCACSRISFGCAAVPWPIPYFSCASAFPWQTAGNPARQVLRNTDTKHACFYLLKNKKFPRFSKPREFCFFRLLPCYLAYSCPTIKLRRRQGKSLHNTLSAL